MKQLLNLLIPEPKKAQVGLPRRRKKSKVKIKTAAEIAIMRQSARIVATVLKEVSEIIKPGMTTLEVDTYAEQRIREMGAAPSFKGYYGFPGSICISINDEVVHGIPRGDKRIHQGDIVKVDTGAFFNGYHGDSCITVGVGKKIKPEAKRLMQAAEEALYKGIEQVKAGNTLLDIAGAVEDHVHSYGYQVVEDFTGHGVGQALHEEPSVFNFRTRDLPNVVLEAGMVLAIEPIVNAKTKETITLKDKWTVITPDKSLSAQFEHTVLVTETGYEILTDRDLV
ncbi:type I methionyl aminopeptidase [Picosynechococcus sp. PCC 11901]|uniref:type I methionyl aminopeptidase n=1 Tax=Picosynechococcus sp. PCC 11901 TaxID=2579791 RepID=UPI0010FC3A3F|nr:type I methionyl aminopeptidase [Picosynechococcus sp. PCC 11901]QCS48172.1 type I methionyl aminopeptidase [Picosynechococcus sp. PCC 11901]